MSALVLVRHGQAAAFEADSDRLTELGWKQARLLGDYWAAHEMVFDQAYVGSLRRHRETAEAVEEAYRTRGVRFPDPVRMPGWDEYDASGVLGQLLPRLASEDPAFAGLVHAFEQAEAHERNRRFQRMFEALIDRWRRGALSADGVEPFAAFYARVQEALAHVTRGKTRQRVVVFTSGGPIGICVQSTFGAPEHAALDISWRVRNSSLTELIFSGERRSLDRFNTTPHLEDPELESFR